MPAPTPPTPIAAVPPTPDRNEGEIIFVPKMYTFLDYFAPFKAYLQSVVTYCSDAITWVAGLVTQAESSAAAAANSASAAAASSDFKGAWSSLSGALSKPATVLHKGAYWMLLNDLANVAASEPGVTADWAFNSGTRWRTPYTASGTLAANSQNTIIATSAPADMSLGTFAANDFFVLHNSPSSTQTVRLMNPSYTIRGKRGSALPGDNIVLKTGEVIHIKAISSSVLETV